MFRRWLNRAAVHVAITPRGPILIKSGQEGADPTRPGMEFVRSHHALHGETVYLPGTSLKGAMRSQAERVLRGLTVEVCDPFDGRSRCRSGPPRERSGQRGRGNRPRPQSDAEIFRDQCPACQTFGSLRVAGRCNVEDAYPWERGGGQDPGAASMSAPAASANATEERHQVGIDRRTGQAARGALFDLEVVVAGTFYTKIHLENFALWQLGLIGGVLADMDQGDVPIGFGKSRGLGQVAVEITSIELESLRNGSAGILGAGALCGPEEARTYGLSPDDTMALPSELRLAPTWRGQRLALGGDQALELVESLTAGPLATWIDSQASGRRSR